MQRTDALYVKFITTDKNFLFTISLNQWEKIKFILALQQFRIGKKMQKKRNEKHGGRLTGLFPLSS